MLIEERAQKLMRSPFWPLYKFFLYPLLLRGRAVKLADEIAPLSAQGTFDHLSDLLKIDLHVSGVEHIPASGRVLIASTHPTGIPDGVAM